ncbi:toll/interleukin-1 receptor domain-containing protein [Oleispirillum naphthae]|uniref:toll/interleukin-1 receptor domain-containing protein n=1 Tax=Oleispirillum naphthae TaxID=2838853 RepID=UPI0030823AF0
MSGEGELGKSAVQNRRIVFLSHATPDDNDIVIWLGARLTAAGYEVWSDVTRLIGGEIFWKDIDEAIRQHAAKVVVCLSKAAVQREGVRNEIAISIATGKKMGVEEFTVPVRIDNLPFDEFPPQLISRNAIDFSGNWASGLSRLLEVLERDKVPKRDGGDFQKALDAWRTTFQIRARAVEKRTEYIESNWLPIIGLPPEVHLFGINVPVVIGDIPRMASAISAPHFTHGRLIGGVADLTTFQAEIGPNVPLSAEYAMDMQAFLAGDRERRPSIDGRDARNFVTSMLRRAWDLSMSDRGLSSYVLADGSTVWWVPSGFLPEDKVHFTKPNGRRGWRQLVGRDNPRNVYWHVGFAARPILTPPFRYVLRPHVILTTDGKTPLDDRKRMNAMKKSVCKLWFNARWRDLVAGFAFWVGNGEEVMPLSMGGSEAVWISARPLQFLAPLAPVGETDAQVSGEFLDSSTDDEDADFVAEVKADPSVRDLEEDESDPETEDSE